MSFQEFREAFLHEVLDLLWAQWCVLGVPGHSKNIRGDCIDPEALILSSCYFGRFDQRLFDGMLEWLIKRENLISSLRLSSLMRNEFPESTGTIKAVAAFLSSQEKRYKWRRIAGGFQPGVKADPFFLYPNGSPVEIFGYQDPSFLSLGFSRGRIGKKNLIGPVRWAHPASLWLRLRAFMGVSSRTEVCVYLTTHDDGGHPSLIARVMGHKQGGVQQALVSMSESGWVMRSDRQREVVYTLADSIRSAFISSLERRPHWLTWPSFFHSIEIVWKSLGQKNLFLSSATVQSSELRNAMQKADSDLSRLGFAGYFLEVQNKKGAEYVDSLGKAWYSLFSSLYEQEAQV
jgi:hypothetical protein